MRISDLPESRVFLVTLWISLDRIVSDSKKVDVGELLKTFDGNWQLLNAGNEIKQPGARLHC